LHTAFHLIQIWGFHYTNTIVWNKKDGLCYNGFHNTLEFVLHAYKGKTGLCFKSPLETYFEAKRIKHSQKPDKFYALLREVTKDPRIDIFARKRHFGFDAWGNQVEKDMEIPLKLLMSKS
jgi:N6-adenosine-specific RNA methylase IME4